MSKNNFRIVGNRQRPALRGMTLAFSTHRAGRVYPQWKNIDVEVEVDIEQEQILVEFGQLVDESSETYWRRCVSALDCMTKIMARVTDEVIAKLPPSGRSEVYNRLITQAERYRPT